MPEALLIRTPSIQLFESSRRGRVLEGIRYILTYMHTYESIYTTIWICVYVRTYEMQQCGSHICTCCTCKHTDAQHLLGAFEVNQIFGIVDNRNSTIKFKRWFIRWNHVETRLMSRIFFNIRIKLACLVACKSIFEVWSFD